VAVEGRRPRAAAALVVAVLAVGLTCCSGGTGTRALAPATQDSPGTPPLPSSASAPGPAGSTGKVGPTLAAGSASGAIPRRSVATLAPVPFSSPGRVGNGVVVRVIGVEPTLTRGTGVGDSAGEAAEAVTVWVDNGTNEPVNLDNWTAPHPRPCLGGAALARSRRRPGRWRERTGRVRVRRTARRPWQRHTLLQLHAGPPHRPVRRGAALNPGARADGQFRGQLASTGRGCSAQVAARGDRALV